MKIIKRTINNYEHIDLLCRTFAKYHDHPEHKEQCLDTLRTLSYILNVNLILDNGLPNTEYDASKWVEKLFDEQYSDYDPFDASLEIYKQLYSDILPLEYKFDGQYWITNFVEQKIMEQERLWKPTPYTKKFRTWLNDFIVNERRGKLPDENDWKLIISKMNDFCIF